MRLHLIDNLTDEVVNIIKVNPDDLPTAPDGFRYEENAGGKGQRLTGGVWVTPTPDAAEALAAERAAMKCTRQQGKLALGAAVWAGVVALADGPDTPWGLKVAVSDTVEWERMDQDMAALIWAMQLTDEQADDLFRLAMTL